MEDKEAVIAHAFRVAFRNVPEEIIVEVASAVSRRDFKSFSTEENNAFTESMKAKFAPYL